MITKNEEYVLSVALASESVASEIVARVIDITPASPAAAQAVLDVISDSKKEQDQIKEYLIGGLCSRKYGSEISEQLNLIVECLEYQAADSVANNAKLTEAQDKLKPLSKESKEYMVICIANRSISKSITDKIDIATAQALNIADAV